MMIKLMIFGVICIGIFFSVNVVYAEESLPLPEGKNVREWESIAAALVAEDRFDEAIIYLDKIIDAEPNNLKALSNKAGLLIHLEKFQHSLEISDDILKIEPNRLSTLQNKGVALRMLNEHEESFDVFSEILKIDPNNELAKQSIARTLTEMPTISTTNSEFSVHIQMIIRDSENNLLGVFESTNARYLPSKFFDMWWNKMSDDRMIETNNNNEIWTTKGITVPEDDHLGMFYWETDMEGWKITLFEVFVPMMEYEGTEKIEVVWTIIKNAS
tara:strand:+ start:68 stop:883 length:816 start_codon:yes stop_codon:yes gene_type:complete